MPTRKQLRRIREAENEYPEIRSSEPFKKIREITQQYSPYIVCPHCGYETGIDPALMDDDAPMPYCPECDEPLFPLNDED